MRALLLFACLALEAPLLQAQPIPFAPPERLDGRIAESAFDTDLADLTGDGRLDVVVANYDFDDEAVSVFENLGGTFSGSPFANAIATDRPEALALADFDGDGRIDVAVFNADDDQITVSFNQGGSLSAASAVASGVDGIDDLVAADLNGDGRLDLIADLRDELVFFPNDGSGGFGAAQRIAGIGANGIAAADLTGDGRPDVLANSFADDGVVFFENDGTGTFTKRTVGTTDNLGGNDVATGDLDGDGDADVIATIGEGLTGDGRVVWFRNDGSGSFGAAQFVADGILAAQEAVAADLDGDGDLDVAAVGGTSLRAQGDVVVATNDGTGSFGPTQELSTSLSRPLSIAAGDVDGDGDADVVVGRALAVTLFRSEANGNPPPPPPPSEDTAAPLLAGGISGARFEGTARDDRADDTGLATVMLRDATNLALDVDAFAAGAERTDFTVTLQQGRQQGTGFVVATDVAGNESVLWICSDGCPPPDDPPPPPPPGDDTVAPIVSGSIQGNRFVGDATDGGTDASGIASVRLAGDAVNLTLAVDPFAEGAAAVGFTLRLQNPRQPGSGTIEATDVAGNTGTLFVDSQDRNRATASAASAALPDAPTLDMAYPNPFTASATVRFGLPEAQPVRVVVYDVTGRTVAVLGDGVAEAGWHEARLDGTVLPSGVYLVRFEAGDTQTTQKLLRVR
ncbi:MAG: T9SS type A sorting domain-containing protein [Bacteroidota bacterium]